MRKFSLTRRHSGLGDLVPQQISFLQGWNRRWYAPNALLVYVPETQAELVEAVTEAINGFGGNVKVTSGGHCYENFVYNDDTQAIINLSALNRVGYDATRGYYVDAGAENWNVYKTLLMSYNLTIPAGSCYAVGAGGHISGGGYGLLSRLHGLTIDHVTGVDIVVKTGSGNAELIYVSAAAGSTTDEQNLFWALRGGGPGNFGAIARFYFETLPVAPTRAIISAFATPWTGSTAGSLAFSEADLTALTTWWAEDMASQEENTWSEFGLLHLNHIANGEISYTLQFVDNHGETEHEFTSRVRHRLRHIQRRLKEIVPIHHPTRPIIGHPGWLGHVPHASDLGVEYTGSSQSLTYLEAVQTLNSQGPNQFGKYKSAYMRKAFPADQISAIYEYLQITPTGVDTSDMAQSLLQVDTYGGKINTVASDATAVPQRSSIMKLQYQTYWNNSYPPGQDNPVQQQAHLTWMEEFYSAVYAAYGGTPDPSNDPDNNVDGCYYNYPDSDLGTNEDGTIDQAMWLYFGDNYRTNSPNLVDVKKTWDPNNYFNSAQSIPTE